MSRRTQQFCPTTGEINCKCIDKKDKISPLLVDLKATLRKLWSDHAFVDALVGKAIIDGSPDLPVLTARVQINQKDIGDQLKPIIGEVNGNTLTALLLQHTTLAAEVTKAAVRKDRNLNNKKDLLFKNGDELAYFLSSLNEERLPLEHIQAMIAKHNQYMLDMTEARINGDYKREVLLFDAFYNETLAMSDAIFNALL